MATKFLETQGRHHRRNRAPDALREEMHTSMAEQVDTTMKRVASMVGDIVRPLGDSFSHLYDSLHAAIAVDSAEVELGVSFSAEGRFFIAKSKAREH